MIKQPLDENSNQIRSVRAKVREHNLRSYLNSDSIKLKLSDSDNNRAKYKEFDLKFED